jgi:hypothetical protein
MVQFGDLLGHAHLQFQHCVLHLRGGGADFRANVVVQREMESGRAPLASITPIPRAIRTAGSGCGQAEEGSRRNHNWFQEKGSQFGGSHSQLARAAAKNQLLAISRPVPSAVHITAPRPNDRSLDTGVLLSELPLRARGVMSMYSTHRNYARLCRLRPDRLPHRSCKLLRDPGCRHGLPFRQCKCQCHRGPACAGGGNPLIVAVREPGIKPRLEAERPRLDVP